MYLPFVMEDGSTEILSFNYGAQLYDRVKETLKKGLVINLVIGFIIYLIMLFFGKFVISIFLRGNEELLEFTANGAKLCLLYFILAGANVLISSYFMAFGKAVQSVVACGRGLFLLF